MLTSRTDSWMARAWRNRCFYLFIFPFFLIFGLFGLYPLLFSFCLSFMKWDGLTAPLFIGMGNYQTLFRDEAFYIALWNTLVIGVMYIPPMFALAFCFALILRRPSLPLRGVMRAIVFLPCITPMVVIAIVFSLLYGAESGLLNWLLRAVDAALPFASIPAIPWTESEHWSKISVSILLVWRWTGYNMVLMLAGLQGIGDEYYEAAKIDGATRLQRLFYITLPLMRPTFVFCVIMSLIGTMFMFEEPFVLTLGGPGMSSTNVGVFLFNLSFTDFRFGYASSAAYVTALMVFIVSLLVLRGRGTHGERVS